MKNKIYLLTGSCMILLLSFFSCGRDEPRDPVPDHSVSIACAPELQSLARTWAATYHTLNPDVEVRILDHSELENLSATGSAGILRMVTDDQDTVAYGEAPWNAVVCREIIVAVVNAGNPFLEELGNRGVSPAEFTGLVSGENPATWGTLLETGSNMPVRLHVLDQSFIYSSFAGFLNVDPSDLMKFRIASAGELRSATLTDPLAIGICRLSDIIDPFSKKLYAGLNLLPVDRNGNGRMDYKESIYADAGSFTRGVWIGKYPRELFHNIYTVSSSQPDNPVEIAFLKWILTDGQVLLDNHGFSNLQSQERIAKARLIDSYQVDVPPGSAYSMPREPIFFTIIFPALLGLMAIILVIRVMLVIIHRNKEAVMPDTGIVSNPVLHEEVVKSPGGLYFDRSHTWAFMEEDGTVKIGIDDFLQHITGPLTRVKMKKPGEIIRKGKPVLSIIQDGKQLDVCAPVSGVIREQNRSLMADTSVLNSSPYSDGWVYRIEPSNWITEIQVLLFGQHYKEWLRGEFTRLKEFFTSPLRRQAPDLVHVLQDGGELKDSILSEYGPETWEEFQTDFLNMAS